MTKVFTIYKDKDGFVTDDCGNVMFSNLPICVISYHDGLYPTIEYVDDENWMDIRSDLDKENYRNWFPIIELMEE